MVALGERASPTGQELLAEFIQYGHQKPFEEIVRRYAGMVFNVCFRITKDKHEAEDAVQAVFLTLALQAKRGAEIKALGPWLQQVAKRLALDIRRSKKRRKTREERHHAEQTVRRESILGDALPSADLDELKTALHEELQKLPAKYRMPLILHYFGGLTRDEMAAELNCKASTLGVRIFRGREMLAGRLSGRGIHISGVALVALLGYAVKRAVSDTLIASTSYAATAMMAGHDGAGFASANVIGLTRRATNAVAYTKLKMAGLTLLLAGTSMGAGAKALHLIPNVNLQQMLSNQLNRLMRPLTEPLSRPLLSQSNIKPPVTVASSTPVVDYTPPIKLATAAPKPAAPVVTPKPAPVVDPPITVASAVGSAKPEWNVPQYKPTVAVVSATSGDDPKAGPAAVIAGDATSGLSTSSSSGGGGGMGGGMGGTASADAPRSSSGNSAQSRFGTAAISTNDLIVGSPVSSGSVSPAAQIAIVQVPAIGGTVTENSAGQLRGWGTIEKTGTLQNNGQVVADGSGVDRTLNLTAFSAVETGSTSTSTSTNTTTVITPTMATASTTIAGASSTATGGASSSTASTGAVDKFSYVSAINAVSQTAGVINTAALTPGTINPPTNGWYAVNHGRLCMDLKPSSADSSVLTWGQDPNSSVLTLTNSVRLALKTDGAPTAGNATDPIPTDLALLAPDRDDAPNLKQITGTTIGLWKVDPSAGAISNADITVCYDSLLANALGASQDSVELWTMNATTDDWSPVDPGSFALDTVDHLAYGSAQDFSYFAVSATPAPGADIEFIRAHQLDAINDPDVYSDTAYGSDAIARPTFATPTFGVQSVPEPVGLPLLLIGAGLLGRRRRRALH